MFNELEKKQFLDLSRNIKRISIFCFFIINIFTLLKVLHSLPKLSSVLQFSRNFLMES